MEEYGATLAEAEAAEERALRDIARERKAGRVTEFIKEPDSLTAYDLMNHDLVAQWLKGRKGD